MKTTLLLFLGGLSCAALAGCGAPRPPEAGGPRVLATVNGVPLTDRDVAHRTARPGMAGTPAHAQTGDALAAVIQDELLSQRAVALGLDRDPEYLVRLDDLEAQVRAFRRQALTGRLRGWLLGRSPVTEAEARAWYERNSDAVRTLFHVQQVLYRGGIEAAEADRAAIAGGVPFEEVAARRLEGRPQLGTAPGDVGELNWYQLPPAWRGVVDSLEPGQVSPVVRDGDRAWIVRLVARRAGPATGFAAERERIELLLRQEKVEAAWSRLVTELRAEAVVVRSPARAPSAERAASAR